MAGKPPGRILQAWYQWKSLRLPWRKKFLVGLDLHGNTYWLFRLRSGDPPPRILSMRDADDAKAQRYRRIVHPPPFSRNTVNLSDLKVPPAWHQWLRYSRPDPPSLDEQRVNVQRIERMAVLAREADRKWEAKERLLDMPAAAPPPSTPPAVPTPAAAAGTEAAQAQRTSTVVEKNATAGAQGQSRPDAPSSATTTANREAGTGDKGGKDDAPNPWKQASRRGPSEEWQPQAWSPTPARRQ